MEAFDLDTWWNKNVDPNLSLLDKMYKEITQEAIAEALKFYNFKHEKEEKMEKDAIDLGDLDLSAVLKK
jgi:glucose-6-phosphate dehydrogenase assembly protein OpcA